MHRGYEGDSAGVSPGQRQPKEDSSGESKEMRTKVSSHLKVGSHTTSVTHTDAQKTQNR